MTNKSFPWWGYAWLAVGSAVATGIYVIRAIDVSATTERVVSAVVFALLTIFWGVLAYLNHPSTEDQAAPPQREAT